jgi:hypothetical protein
MNMEKKVKFVHLLALRNYKSYDANKHRQK